MNTIKIFLLLNTFFTCIYSYTLPYMQLNNIIPKTIQKKEIYNQMANIIQSKMYSTYIVNGPVFNNPTIKKDITKIIFENNLINFKELTFNEYITKKPNLFCKDTAFYIKDYLINDGRVLNEEEKLTILKKNSNYIFLDANDIDTIPIKDTHFNKKMIILNFPIILKKDLINYIYDLIECNKYNEYLYLVNWNMFELDKLNFTNIQILLDKVDNYFFKMNNINDINTVNEKNLNKYILTIINILRKN